MYEYRVALKVFFFKAREGQLGALFDPYNDKTPPSEFGREREQLSSKLLRNEDTRCFNRTFPFILSSKRGMR